MGAFTGMIFTIAFCMVGPAVDGKCADGSPAMQAEVHIFLSALCNVKEIENCPLDEIIEVKRDGKVIASIPGSVLSEQERKLFMQNVAGWISRHER